MSELPELPPAPRRTRPLPAGGLDAAVTAGRRRRARAVGYAGGATTALSLVLAGGLLLPGGGGAQDTLDSADRPTPAPTAAGSIDPAPDPVAEPTGVPPPTGVPTPAPGGGQPGPRAADEPGPASGSGTAPRPSSSASVLAGPAPVPAERPAYREDTDEDAAGSALCTPSRLVSDGAAETGTTTTAAGCSYRTSSGATAQRGDQVTASYGRCSSSGSPDTVYAFGGGQEKEVVVTDSSGAEVFRFSSTVRYVEGPHERRLQARRCIEWTGRWDLVTTDGRPVPAGEYRMTTTVAADRVYFAGEPERGTPDVRETSSVTVTVRD